MNIYGEFTAVEREEIIEWLSEHETAFEDFNNYFNNDTDDLDLESIVGWISEHDTLYDDFCEKFPQYCEDYSGCDDCIDDDYGDEDIEADERGFRALRDIEDEDERCCICGDIISGWGNNPWPVCETGRCCDKCNGEKVIPARIAMI